MLAFSRKQILNPELLNVNELISELSGMLTRVLDERVKLELRLGSKVGNIEADRSQIEQVILNLVVNARDAMPHGGVLTIDTFTASFPQDKHPELEGEYSKRFASAIPGSGSMTQFVCESSNRSLPPNRRVEAQASVSRQFMES